VVLRPRDTWCRAGGVGPELTKGLRKFPGNQFDFVRRNLVVGDLDLKEILDLGRCGGRAGLELDPARRMLTNSGATTSTVARSPLRANTRSGPFRKPATSLLGRLD
jgi:hypothetical protein